MHRYQRPSLRASLIILVAAILGLTVFSAVVIASFLTQSRAEIADIREVGIPKTLLAENVRKLIGENARLTLQLVVADAPSELIAQKSMNRQRVTAYLKELESLVHSVDERALLAETIGRRNMYVESFTAAGDMIRSGRLAEARAHIRTDTLAKLERLDEVLDRFIDYQESHIRDRIDTAYASFMRVISFGGLTMLALFLVTGLLSLWIFRRMLRLLGGEPSEALIAAHEIAAGNLDRPVPARNGDGSNLMAALEAMRLRLRELVLSLKEKNKELSANNASLEMRVAERTSALAEKERKMRKILDTAVEGYALIDAHTYAYKEVNDSLCRLLGYPREEIIGKRPIDFCDPGNVGVFEAKLATITSTDERRYEVTMRRKDGSPVFTKYSANTLRDESDAVLESFAFITDVSDIVLAGQQLQEAKEQAEKANLAKSEFLSSMSHELRTPLNAVIGFAQVLESDPDYPLAERQDECVKHILKAGWHLLELINEVLDLSKIEAGRLDLSMETVDLLSVARECLDLIGPVAEKQGIALENEIAAPMRLRADKIRLKQAILNLLSNAVKYNRRGGRAILSAQEAGEGRVRILVKDTGMGIETDQLGQLFVPFNRLVGENAGIEGTGVGLALTKKLVELMGGSIGVDSRIGAGTVFWIELHREIEAPDEGPAPMVQAEPPPLSPSAFTLLYVEDNQINAQLVKAIYRRHPEVRLIVAANGSLGLEFAHAHRPDLILLDINLPGMDGYEVKRRLDADEATAGIPVVAVSANAMPQDLEKGTAAGFADYLTKPIDIRRLEAAVDRVLASKKAMR